MEIQQDLIGFITEELMNSTQDVHPDDSLIGDGLIDSLAMLRLVSFLEEKYGIMVPPEDFTIEHFRTVNLLSGYVERTLAGA